jgi:hypothetical protein
MTWYAVSIPPSASRLLGNCRFEHYSETQALAAMLHAFAQLPVGERVILARHYLQQQDLAAPNRVGDGQGPPVDHGGHAPGNGQA